MTINTVIENGKETYVVVVSKRSPLKPGVRVQRRRLGIKTLAEAKKLEKQLTEEVSREVFELEGKGIRWSKLLEKWEHALLTGNTSTVVTRWTAEDYTSNLRTYTKILMNRYVEDVTRVDILDVLKQIENAQLSYRTQERLISAVNGMFRWGIDSRLIDARLESPASGIRLKRVRSKKPEILTLEEIRRFLETAKAYNHPWYPVWAMAFLTGMRSGELHALLWKDIDFDARIISVTKSYTKRAGGIVKGTKSGDWREVPINDELLVILKQLNAQANGREHVLPRFPDWDRGNSAIVTRTFLEGHNLPSVKFHTLRACFATQLIRNGVAPGIVMKICGWKDLKTMQFYVRLAGIEIQGATDSLNFITEKQAMGKIVELFRGK